MSYGFLCTFFQKYWNWKRCFMAFLSSGSCFCSWAVLNFSIMRRPTFLYPFHLAFRSSWPLCPARNLFHLSVPMTFLSSPFLHVPCSLCHPHMRCALPCPFLHVPVYHSVRLPYSLSGSIGNIFAVRYGRIHKTPKLLHQWFSFFFFPLLTYYGK